MNDFLNKTFKLKENNTDVKTEILSGITTFMTMAYILAVNPNILSAAGMDPGAVFTATALASLIATLLMAAMSNYPFVLSAGMGLNAYFAYTVVLTMGYTWEQALAAVFVEGLIFILLTLTSVREAIFNSIPRQLKYGVSAGIGLFIAFIGLQNCKLVISNDATLVSVFSFQASIADGTFANVGITVVLAIVGIIVTSVLMAKRIKGNILWGILITWCLGMLCQAFGLYVPNPELGMYSLFPDFSNGIGIQSIAPTFMHMDFSIVTTLNFITILLAFLFVDLFDTLGTLMGVASKADMLDKDGKLPKIKGALLADAIGTSAGAVLGTSTITTYVESAAGVAEGGRTGLTSVVAALLFGASLFLAPIFLAIPSFATAPALILVGFLMLSSLLKIDFNEASEAVPAYIATIAMPFTYSIAEGIALGVISYVLINVCMGKVKKPSPLMYILAVLFALKYIIL